MSGTLCQSAMLTGSPVLTAHLLKSRGVGGGVGCVIRVSFVRP